MHGHADAEQRETSEQLMQTLIRCFEDPTAETLPIAKRETRHQAAIDLLHWCDKHPRTPLKIEEISSEIYQSQTSLFQGSKEHFQRTPIELQRSIRLDRVRQLLINPKQRQRQGLHGVSEIVEAMSFSSRAISPVATSNTFMSCHTKRSNEAIEPPQSCKRSNCVLFGPSSAGLTARNSSEDLRASFHDKQGRFLTANKNTITQNTTIN